MISRFWFSQFVIIGLLIIIISGCKKESDAIIKKDPIVTWANPTSINAGIVLSTKQLNATANVEGSFIYDPAIGTSLAVGSNHVLKVNFIPADSITYNRVAKTVKINVTQPMGDGGLTSAVFNTLKAYGTMTDQDGNVYKTITIGNQTWMAENLRVTKYRNGDLLTNVNDSIAWRNLTTGAYCSNENTTDKDKIATYGRLYNGFVAVDNRNIAPVGWHVPSDAEWTILTTALSGANVAGNKMKEAGMLHWSVPNTNATNESGFTALPGGCRDDDKNAFYFDFSEGCYWWSSTITGNSQAWSQALYYSYAGCDRSSYPLNSGFSIRCVKD